MEAKNPTPAGEVSNLANLLVYNVSLIIKLQEPRRSGRAIKLQKPSVSSQTSTFSGHIEKNKHSETRQATGVPCENEVGFQRYAYVKLTCI